MAMDHETVKFLRFLCIGAAAGHSYYGMLGGAGGALIGYIVGSNVVDLFKGRASK